MYKYLVLFLFRPNNWARKQKKTNPLAKVIRKAWRKL